MTNNQLTDAQISNATLIRLIRWADEHKSHYFAAVLRELQERRKTAEPELKPANLANKFYERYPLATFKSDSERAEAFGYFMAGAELQCFGEFIKYEDLCCDE